MVKKSDKFESIFACSAYRFVEYALIFVTKPKELPEACR